MVRAQQEKLSAALPQLPPLPTATIVKPPASPSDPARVSNADPGGPVTPLVHSPHLLNNAIANATTTPAMPPTAVTAIAMETATTPTPNASRPASPLLPALPMSTTPPSSGGEKTKKDGSTKKGKRGLDSGKLNQIHPRVEKLDLRDSNKALEQRLSQVVLDNQLDCLQDAPQTKADLPLLDTNKVSHHKVSHIVSRVGGGAPLPVPSTTPPPLRTSENCIGRIPVDGDRMSPSPVPATRIESMDPKVIRGDRSERTDTKQENRTLDHRITDHHRTENPKEQQLQQQQSHHYHHNQAPPPPHPGDRLHTLEGRGDAQHRTTEHHLENNKSFDHKAITKVGPHSFTPPLFNKLVQSLFFSGFMILLLG